MMSRRDFVVAGGAAGLGMVRRHAAAAEADTLAADRDRLLWLLPTWEPDAAVRRTILTDNPARLFGFAA